MGTGGCKMPRAVGRVLRSLSFQHSPWSWLGMRGTSDHVGLIASARRCVFRFLSASSLLATQLSFLDEIENVTVNTSETALGSPDGLALQPLRPDRPEASGRRCFVSTESVMSEPGGVWPMGIWVKHLISQVRKLEARSKHRSTHEFLKVTELIKKTLGTRP